jgi:hypothetical protein
MEIFKKILIIMLLFSLGFMTSACDDIDEPIDDENGQGNEELPLSYRQDRNLADIPEPSNELREEELPELPEEAFLAVGDNPALLSGDYRLEFTKGGDGYGLQIVYLPELSSADSNATAKSIMFENPAPAKIFFRSSKSAQVELKYDSVTQTSFGYLGTATATSEHGSVVRIEDRYYLPEGWQGVFNVRRLVFVEAGASKDRGFQSVYDISTPDNYNNYEWFVPNNIFGNFPNADMKIYRETLLGLPMMMFRNKNNGYALSLARFRPIIHPDSNSYAGFAAIRKESDNNSKIEITYPSRDTTRKTFDLKNGNQIVYDLSLRAEKTESFSQAMASFYNAHYMLENPRIVNTDINEVYRVIHEDFKEFMLSNTRNGITSYGLPWRITIETGKIGPMSYQSGFVGQQVPAGYNMMLYGVMNNDLESLRNGANILDFWIEAGMMNDSGVPRIWYFGDSNNWHYYPTFLRMAIDTMEGYLDAYRLAVAHGISRPEWLEAITMFADFLVRAQNPDGSWYRCYNWSGGRFRDGDNGIREPGGNITQSESKKNTTMPVRFLGKMYELTGKDEYKTAALAAGDYIYNHLYPENKYYGGTCDNPNAVDKEAGVFAMYAYDALYMLTKDEKWIECLKQATAFTMSTVLVISFPIKQNASDLKAALPLKYGYTDGSSFIVCEGTGVDNYIAYIYYQLFRIYILTGEEVYLKQAEFIQQNTKSIMDWDGALGYPYRSLVAEASTIWSFGFGSAVDDEGIMGVWLPWSSVANAEPIAKMLVEFGKADVMAFRDVPLEELRAMLDEVGIGGNSHRIYPNNIVQKLK